MIALIVVLILCVCASWYAEQMKVPFARQLLVFALILVLGLRYYVGRDYPTYEYIYYNPDSYQAQATEPIWHGINWLLRALGFESRMFFFLTAAITILLYSRGISRISPNFYASMLLFILFGFYFGAANTIRQYVAMSILFGNFDLVIQNRLKPYLVLILIAMLFHTSAIVMLPIVLVVRIRFPQWLLIAIVLFTFFFGNLLMNFAVVNVFPILDLYNYQPEDFDTGIGSGVLKLMYNFVVIALLLLYMYERKNARNSQSFVLVMNMVVFGVVLYNVFYEFMVARRLYEYCFPFIVVLIPYCMKYFRSGSRYFLMAAVCAIFLAFLVKANMGLPYSMDLNFF